MAMKQRERTKRSVFMTKKRLVSSPRKTPLSSWILSWDKVSLRYLTRRRTAATDSPLYCATTVPAGIPTNPIPSMPTSPTWIPNASTILIRTFMILTVRSTVIALTLSCIPMNQPLNAINDRVAGAAQILMKKYLDASSCTSGVHSTNRNAAFTNIHWIIMRTAAHESDMPNDLVSILAHSFLS